MMPQLVTVRVGRPHRRPVRIWIPVIPVLVLFAPIVVLVVVGILVACMVFHINAARALGSGWGIVSALPGLRVDFEQGPMDLLVTIR